MVNSVWTDCGQEQQVLEPQEAPLAATACTFCSYVDMGWDIAQLDTPRQADWVIAQMSLSLGLARFCA